MIWYTVEALFKCEVMDKTPDDILYEKTVFLIKSDNPGDNEQKAQQIAKQFEVTYQNEVKDDVRWQFVKLLQIQSLEVAELHDGIEVHSQLMWASEVAEI